VLQRRLFFRECLAEMLQEKDWLPRRGQGGRLAVTVGGGTSGRLWHALALANTVVRTTRPKPTRRITPPSLGSFVGIIIAAHAWPNKHARFERLQYQR
jgi:hypothetical protein